MRNHGLKVFGLCLATAMSAIALPVVSAQAEPGSHWNVNGKATTAPLSPALQTTLENNHGMLLTKILGKSITVLCTAIELQLGVLKTEGESLGKFRFTGCLTLIDGKVMPPCEPIDVTEKGVILTNPLKGLIILHSGSEAYDRLEPEEGSILANILTSDECAIGEKIPVIGKFVAKDCKNQARTELVTHLAEEGPLTEMWVLSKIPEHKTTIDGSANVFLSGTHTGLTWSATPA